MCFLILKAEALLRGQIAKIHFLITSDNFDI